MEKEMHRKVYNKLVRDRIPEIVKVSGRTCECETLSDEAYIRKLDEKLNEELADLLEVMEAVVRARGHTWDDLIRIRTEKRTKRGGFEKKILLKEIVGE